MSNLVPFIQKHEQAMICNEINGRFYHFNGTTRLREALVVVIRFVNDDWRVWNNDWLGFRCLLSVNGEELARDLISILSIMYNIALNLLLPVMRYLASLNTAALRTVKVVYPKMTDIDCFSHTLDRVHGGTGLHSTPYRVYQHLD